MAKMRSARINVGLLSLAQCLYMTATISVFTFSGLVGQILAPGPGLATLPISLVMVGTALSTFPASFLMRRFGRKTGFITGATSGALSGLLSAVAIYFRSFELLCFAGFLQGLYQASALYYRFAAMEVTAPHQHGRAVAYVLAGGVGAALIAPTLARFANGLFEPVTFMGVYVMLGLLAILVMIPISQITIPPVVKTDFTGPVRPTLEIIRQPVFICAVVAAACGYALMTFVMTAAPLAIVACGFQPGDAANVVQWHVLAMFLPSFFVGHLMARIGIIPLLLLGILFYVISASVALDGLTIPHFGVTMVCLGIAWNFMYTGGTTLLAKSYTLAEKAKIQGLNELLIFAATASASLAAGAILNGLGWMFVNMMMFVILTLVAVVVLWYAAGERRERLAN